MENRVINTESTVRFGSSHSVVEFVWWDLSLCLENDVYLPASQIRFISEMIKKNTKQQQQNMTIPSSLAWGAHTWIKLAQWFILFII